MKHLSLIIDPYGQVLTQYEVGYLSMIDMNRSISPNHPKDVAIVVFDPDMEDLKVPSGQHAAYSKTFLDALAQGQPFTDVRTPVRYWKDVQPDIVSVWLMEGAPDGEALLMCLDLPGDNWDWETGPSWRVQQPPQTYPGLSTMYRRTLKKKAHTPLPFPA